MMPKRSDSNQKEIVLELRRIGATVQDLHVLGRGVPDLLVGYQQKNYLIEVKTEKGKLTPSERDWFSDWNGQATIVHNVDEAYRAIGLTIE